MTTQSTLRDYLLTTEDAISAGRVTDAMVNCQYILTHYPESLEGQRLLGEVYLAQGQLEEAQQTFDWVLTNDPENVIVYCDRALISEQMQDYDTALDCYQQAYELSRGNSEIRHEFNLLSEKVGQTSFIFSRAGLARLYMRGDLLPQAIQEWEIVLNSNPDRLDARTGLLETLWREGLFDRVEQLATQILNDIPGCLKALLLLAHVTFAQNALKAQELVKQVEMLDPDLIKAQELFSDFMAHSPKDPFLKLLHKAPITFPATSNGKLSAASAATHVEQHTNGTTPFADPLVRWSSLDNIIEPQQEYQTVQEGTSFGNWTDNSTADFGGWSTFGQSPSPVQPAAAAQPTQQEVAKNNQPVGDSSPDANSWNHLPQNEAFQDETLPDDWHIPQPEEEQTNATPIAQEQEQQEQQQPWYHVDVFEEPSFNSWSNAENIAASSSGISWGIDEQETENPAPPAWLDMLTGSEWRQPDANPPAQPIAQPGEGEQPLSEEEATTPLLQSLPTEEAVTPPQQQTTAPAEAEADTPLSWSEQIATGRTINPPSLDDEEPFFFGPEWLKSLGATEIGSTVPPVSKEPEAEIALPTPVTIEPATATFTTPTPSIEDTTPVFSTAEPPATPVLPEHTEKVPFEQWLDRAAQKLNQPEQNVLTTLEELEKDLRSQGFMPLKPGSLSSLASSTNETTETDKTTLSAALAQFGNPEAEPVLNEAPAQAQPSQQVQPMQPPATPNHLDALSSFSSQVTPTTSEPNTPQPARMEEASSSLITNTTSNLPPSPTTATSAPGSVGRSDSPFDTELETTMKRPAVRLQAMQPRQPGQPMQPASPQQAMLRGRPGESSTTGKAASNSAGTINYKERLLRGYQYQLAGSYDEAMQEYRTIIRNAPDLLGEVVSNMRALLKLAPKYSAGYRVLGDAYMRQGEYLQAMEAYNKALAMAKKVKS